MAISNKNIRIYVNVTKDTHDWLKEEGEREDRNVSNLVNFIIKKHREEKEKAHQE